LCEVGGVKGGMVCGDCFGGVLSGVCGLLVGFGCGDRVVLGGRLVCLGITAFLVVCRGVW